MSDKHYYEAANGSVLHSSSASGAAAKAYRQMRATMKSADRKRPHVIHLRRRSDGKKFSYQVREEHNPVDIEKDGKIIHFDYSTKVKSLNMGKSKSKSKSKSNSKSKSKSKSKSRK